MIEIIPNWHPIFVHFTVALFSLAVGLFVVIPFVKPPLQQQWQIVARWALWFGAGFTILTGLTGLYAYNTVAHDTPSHLAMTEHRNWAIATIVLFLTLTAWSVLRVRRNQTFGTVFIIALVISGGVLASTAWHGGEVVYRYGLGVMSLPKVEGEGHSHSHADGGGHESKASDVSNAMDKTADHQKQDSGHHMDDQQGHDGNAKHGDRHEDGHDHTH